MLDYGDIRAIGKQLTMPEAVKNMGDDYWCHKIGPDAVMYADDGDIYIRLPKETKLAVASMLGYELAARSGAKVALLSGPEGAVLGVRRAFIQRAFPHCDFK